MTLQAIRWENNKLQILDQLKLPKETEYIDVKNVEDGWQVINKMQVGGASCLPSNGDRPWQSRENGFFLVNLEMTFVFIKQLSHRT